MVQTFEDLVVWQKAKSLSVEIYRCTDGFPKHELFSLTSQIRRAAVSIAANIAEGSERRTSGAYAHHLDIAIGSAAELYTHICIAEEVGYVSNETKAQLAARISEVTKMLNSLYYTIKKRAQKDRSQ